MRVIEKRLRIRLQNAERQITELEQELRETRDDRQLFRDHFIRRFRWWIELLGEKKTPSLQWLIEDDAKELRRVKHFIW